MRHGIRAARCASSAPSRFLLTTAQRVPSEGYHVVTGADAGLGLATTAALIEAGSTVVLGCANASRGQALAQKINAVTQRRSAIVCSDDDLDLGSTRSIAAFCDGLRRQLQQDGSRLASLVHHAGVMGLGKYTPTADGDETQWAMNYKGPFRLTHCLWDQILEDNTDVLCLTSASHCAPNLPLDFSMASSCESTYHGWRAYQCAATARRLPSGNVTLESSRGRASPPIGCSLSACRSLVSPPAAPYLPCLSACRSVSSLSLRLPLRIFLLSPPAALYFHSSDER